MKSTKSEVASDHGTTKKVSEHKQFALTVEVFLLNVNAARISGDSDLQFATGAKYYPDTFSGLWKKAVRKMKRIG